MKNPQTQQFEKELIELCNKYNIKFVLDDTMLLVVNKNVNKVSGLSDELIEEDL